MPEIKEVSMKREIELVKAFREMFDLIKKRSIKRLNGWRFITSGYDDYTDGLTTFNRLYYLNERRVGWWLKVFPHIKVRGLFAIDDVAVFRHETIKVRVHDEAILGIVKEELQNFSRDFPEIPFEIIKCFT